MTKYYIKKLETIIACALALSAHAVFAETWSQTAAGAYSWDDAANWGGIAYPNGVDAVANISADFAGAETINLNQGITVGSLTVNDSGGGTDSVVSIAAGTAGSLTFQTSSGSAALTSTSANGITNSISAPVVFNSNTTISTGTSATGTNMTLSGALSGSGTITKSGGGPSSGQAVLSLTNADNSGFTGNWVLSGNTTNSVLAIAGDLSLGAVPVSAATPNITLTNSNAIQFNSSTTLHANRTIQVNSGASLALNPTTSVTATVAGKITGAGSLIQSGNGTGTLVLNNDSSDFSGQVSIYTGTMNITSLSSSGNASALGAGTIINFGNFTFNGGGTINYTGTGTTTDRRLLLSHATASGSTSSAVFNNNGTGAVVFTDTANVVTASGTGSRNLTLGGSNTGNNTFNALINANGTGTVSFSKTGSGTWILGNTASSYTGTTTISAGLLSVSALADGGSVSSIGASDNGANRLVIGNNATLRYTGAGSSTNRLFQVGQTTSGSTITLDASGTGGLNFTNTGALTYGTANQTRTLVLAGTNTDNNTLTPVVANNGTAATALTKNGTGKWILAGTNTYTGNTTVNGGTLLVNGSLGNTAVTVNSGATFGGTGTVAGGVTIANGATLSPGASIESLDTGTLSLNSGSTLALEVNTSLGTSDLLNVTGNFNIASGAILTLSDLGANAGLNTVLTIVDYSGSWNNGLFTYAGDVLSDDSSFVFGSNNYTINYNDGSAVTLSVTAIPEPSLCILFGLGASALFLWRRNRQVA